MSNLFNKKFDLEFIMLQGPKGEQGDPGEPGRDGSGASYDAMTQSEAVEGTATNVRVVSASVLRNAIITDDEYLYLARELATNYETGILYKKGIFVINDDKIYQRNEDMTETEPWTVSNWTLIATFQNGTWILN